MTTSEIVELVTLVREYMERHGPSCEPPCPMDYTCSCPEGKGDRRMNDLVSGLAKDAVLWGDVADLRARVDQLEGESKDHHERLDELERWQTDAKAEGRP